MLTRRRFLKGLIGLGLGVIGVNQALKEKEPTGTYVNAPSFACNYSSGTSLTMADILRAKAAMDASEVQEPPGIILMTEAEARLLGLRFSPGTDRGRLFGYEVRLV